MEYEWLFNSSNDATARPTSFNTQKVNDLIDSLPTEIKKRKLGRPPIVSKRPTVIPKIRQAISQSSTAAQSRRRNDTEYTFGISLGQIQKVIETECQVIMSKHTVHRTMLAPHQRWRTAQLYKGYVKARVPPKSNCKTTRDHADFRYTCVQVNYVNELAALYESEVLMLSSDDKNKVNIGTAAVSRYCKYQSFFDTSKLPDLPDHDFPIPNSKMTPSGYMVLTKRQSDKRSRSISPAKDRTKTTRHRSVSPPCRRSPILIKDSCQRQHVVWPRSGQLNVFLHSDRFFSSTSQMHLNQLLELLPSELNSTGKTVVTAICDGGPDWRTDSPANVVNYGRLWKDLDLDALILTSYSPYHSRFNPIERGWSPLTKWLVGTIIPATLPGESVIPQLQDIPQAEKDAKVKQVHDNATKICSQIWESRYWGGFPVRAFTIPCDGSTLRYNDHNTLKRLTDCPLYALSSDLKDISKEYKFYARHLVRKTYQLEYTKCHQITCSHCGSRPVRAHRFMDYLARNGGTIPVPTWSSAHPDHYQTFLETFKAKPHGPKQIIEYLPSCKEPQHSCNINGCGYIPAIPTDEKRHKKLVHH